MHIYAQKKSISLGDETEREWHVWYGSGDCDAPVFVTDTTTSVLDEAWRLVAHDALPVWGSVLAHSQSAGRGQSRRPWYSPKGNVFAALRLPSHEPFTTLAAAPAISALLLRAFSCMDMHLQLKWPNDIVYCKGGVPTKVGGILLEERDGVIIAGIGLNSASAPENSFLRENFALPAGILPINHEGDFCLIYCNERKIIDKIPLAERLWLHLVYHMKFCYGKQLPVAFDWRDFVHAHILWKNCLVKLDDGDAAPVIGILRDIAPSGALVLAVDSDNKGNRSDTLVSQTQDVFFFSGSLTSAARFS